MFQATEISDRTFEWSFGLTTQGAWSATSPWVEWSKSWVPGCSFIDVFLVGAGGGGGGGATKNAVGNAGGGGAGGAAAGTCRARFPLMFLPDTVYFYLPDGGAGGTTGTTGTAGGPAVMASRPGIANPTVAECFMVTSNSNAGGGGGGSAGAGGTGGVAAGLATAADCSLSFYSTGILFIAGLIGAAGGLFTGAIGSGQIDTAKMVISGCGGGGSQSAAFAGGSISARGMFPALAGGAGGASPVTGDSGTTFRLNDFIVFSSNAGAGGGSTNTAATVGAAGGNAGIGSGGGGGGAGVSAGGVGGTGGDSYMLLVAS